MREDRVGIVIPAFNAGRLVTQAADSARTALGSARNIVVVDDGSTERESCSALDELSGAGFTLIRQPQGGVSAARNAGLSRLDVPFAFVLDSDDLIGEGAPTAAADIFEREADAVIVAGSGIEFTDVGHRSEPLSPGTPSRDQMWNGSWIATASAFRLIDWKSVGGFPNGVAFGEDWVFWMRLLRGGGRVAVSDAVFVHRRIHSGQVTSGYVDPRESAKARNLVLRENPDLLVSHQEEFLQELVRARSLLAEYRHRYRHANQIKHALREAMRGVRRSGER